MEIHNNVESEINRCLKKKLDPVIVKNILDAKFPGFMECFKENLENIANYPFITKLTDKITKSEKIKEFFALIQTIIKIEGKYVDTFKDIGLSLLMLKVIGGFSSIVDLPENFTSVMVVTMFFSITGPLILSTLHLAVNNPSMIVRSDGNNVSTIRRVLTMGLCFLLSVVNPIILESYYEEKKEEARKLIQIYSKDAIVAIKKCRKIKQQAVEFLRIELG